jgi:hypothetical protein
MVGHTRSERRGAYFFQTHTEKFFSRACDMDVFLQRALVANDDQVWTWDERTQHVSMDLYPRGTRIHAKTATTTTTTTTRQVLFPRGAIEPVSAWRLLGRHVGVSEDDPGANKRRCIIELQTTIDVEATAIWEAMLPNKEEARVVPVLPLAAHGVLISCLQKAIRLRETACALRLVYTIAMQSTPTLTAELLRRLPIILVEDAAAHPLIPSLMFLMLLASPPHSRRKDKEEGEEGEGESFKGLSRSQLCLVLRVIQQICGSRIPAEHRCLGYEWYQKNPLIVGAPSTDAFVNPMLMALAVRGAFGGMGGDMEMLGHALLCWRERACGASLPAYWVEWTNTLRSPTEQPLWSLHGLDARQETSWWFTTRDQLLTAVDHHCSNMLARIPQKFSDTPIPASAIGELQHLVWERRSSVYRRICCCKPTGFLDRFCRDTWQYRMRPQILSAHLPPPPPPPPHRPKLSRKRLLEQSTAELTRSDAAAAATPDPRPPPKRITDFFGKPS